MSEEKSKKVPIWFVFPETIHDVIKAWIKSYSAYDFVEETSGVFVNRNYSMANVKPGELRVDILVPETNGYPENAGKIQVTFKFVFFEDEAFLANFNGRFGCFLNGSEDTNFMSGHRLGKNTL